MSSGTALALRGALLGRSHQQRYIVCFFITDEVEDCSKMHFRGDGIIPTT